MLWIIGIFGGILLVSQRLGEVHGAVIEETGCFHNGTLFADGSLVPTTEPCLSCQCNGRTLICSLRICPEMPMPPPRGCVLVQKKNSCCAYLSCTKYHTLYNGPNRRIIAYLDHFERETLDRMVSENVLFRRSDDSDIDGSGEICIHNGTVYKSGSAMSSSSLCSYCYCIGGIQKCVKPKCMLSMDGCKPIFVDSTCCPVRYDCSSKSSGIMKSQNHIRRAGNKHYQRMAQRLQRGRGCIVNSEFYPEGQKMPADGDKPCDICFCIRGSRKCAPKKCAPALRNCIPVVPKGQCCPSSYDCGISRDPHRGYLPRQFDLFSLLFGSDESENATSDVSSENTEHTSSTSEKSILDAIREGLEFIDNNEGTVVNVLEDLNDKEDFPTKNNTLDQFSEENHKVSFNDAQSYTLQDDSVASTSPKVNTTSTEPVDPEVDIDNSKNSTNLLDSLSKDELYTSTVTSKNDNESTTFETPDFDYITLSENENSYQETSEPESLADVTDFSTVGIDSEISDNDDHITNWNITTTDSIFKTTPETINMKTSTIIITEHPVHDSEPTLTLKDDEIEVISPTNESQIQEVQTPTEQSPSEIAEIVLLPHKNISESKIPESEKTDKVVSSAIPNMEMKDEIETAGEQPEDFLSALFNGLSTIFKEKENETKHKIEPILHDETYNTTKEELIINANTKSTVNSSETLKDNAFKNDSELTESFSRIPVSTTKIASIKKESLPVVTESPLIIKTNPSILEADFSLDYNNPTLPPSLPNLKIIPFLPADAVKNDRKQPGYDFYSIQSTPFPLITGNSEAWPINTATKNIESKLDYERYPSITEKYVSTPYSDNYVPYDNNKKFTYDDYEYSEFDIANRHSDKYLDGYVHNKYNNQIKKIDTMLTNADENQHVGVIHTSYPGFIFDHKINRFSPPTKTEGGFIPKNPVQDTKFYYDNYHTTKLFVELTTANPKINENSSKLGISTPDPFKDVIKTEPPPDLHLLIEDKEKLLANAVAPTFYEPPISIDNSQFDKEIISITTDSSYNYKSEYKDANNIVSENLPVIISSSNNASENIKVSVIGVPLREEASSDINFEGNPTFNEVKEKPLFENKTNIINEELDYKKILTGSSEANSNKTKVEVVKNRTNNKILMHDKVKEGTEFNFNKSESVANLNNLKDILASTSKNDPPVEPLPLIQSSNINSLEQTSTPSSTTKYPILSEPFNKLPFLNPSFPVKPHVLKKEALNQDFGLDVVQGHTYNSHNQPTGYEIVPNGSTNSYGINPMNIDDLPQHQSEGPTQVFTKPHTTSNLRDPAGILKLAGCNIYGRMYRVGRIISELSGPCLECKCTEIGVNCTQLEC